MSTAPRQATLQSSPSRQSLSMGASCTGQDHTGSHYVTAFSMSLRLYRVFNVNVYSSPDELLISIHYHSKGISQS